MNLTHKPVRVLVAEDERPQREELIGLIAELWPEAQIVATCEDGLEALESIDRAAPDIALLDIQMPGMSGIDLAIAIAGRAHVVFVTAYDQYAIRAFEHGAIDYLLKPIRRDRMEKTVERLRARVAKPPSEIEDLVQRLRHELARSPKPDELQWITASMGDTVKLISIDEVVALRSQDKYTQVLTVNDDALIRKSLREIVQQLDGNTFWQVHRSVVVRVSAIDTVQRDQAGRYSLTLKGRAETLPVSSALHSRFRGM